MILKLRSNIKGRRELLVESNKALKLQSMVFSSNTKLGIEISTGFYDSKDNEIFEGDILTDTVITDEGPIESLQQVYWCQKMGAWLLDNSYSQNKTNGQLLSEELNNFKYTIYEPQF